MPVLGKNLCCQGCQVICLIGKILFLKAFYFFPFLFFGVTKNSEDLITT